MRDSGQLYPLNATPFPWLARIQNTFGNLFAEAIGSVLVSHAWVAEAEVENHG